MCTERTEIRAPLGQLRLAPPGIEKLLQIKLPSTPRVLLKCQNTYKMPIQDHFELPKTAQELPVGDFEDANLLLCFISSTDPVSKQSWCPDVRAALPRLDIGFTSQLAPKLAYVHVGQRPEYVHAKLASL
jgi:hypothetical protein